MDNSILITLSLLAFLNLLANHPVGCLFVVFCQSSTLRLAQKKQFVAESKNICITEVLKAQCSQLPAVPACLWQPDKLCSTCSALGFYFSSCSMRNKSFILFCVALCEFT